MLSRRFCSQRPSHLVDMQIESAARLKSTLSDLSALEISRNISFGAPPPILMFFCDVVRKLRDFEKAPREGCVCQEVEELDESEDRYIFNM